MDAREAYELTKRLELPQATLGRISKTHDSVVNNYLHGKSVSAENALKIETALLEIERWVSGLPFMPSFKNWQAVQQALADYRAKHLAEVGIEKVREEFGVSAPGGDSLEVETQARLTELGVTAGLGSKK